MLSGILRLKYAIKTMSLKNPVMWLHRLVFTYSRLIPKLRKTETIISLIINLFLISSISTQCEGVSQIPQLHASEGRRLFRVILGSPAAALLEEVERSYGKQVREEETDKFPSNTFGESKIDQEGTPVITINPSRGRTERNIVHELYHLKLKAEGFPTFKVRYVPVQPSPESRQVLSVLIPRFNEIIQHWIFYPEMRKMRLDPAADLKSDFERDIKMNKFPNMDNPDGINLSLLYWKATLELNDPKLLDRIEEWYKRKGWNASLAVGKMLQQIVSSAVPRRADEAVNVLLRCLNAFFEGEFRFELEGWDKEMRGAFVQHIAIIRILPTY